MTGGIGAVTGVVVAVARDGGHRFSKPTADVIQLLADLGVEGDSHCGASVQHLSRVRRDPGAPNLRQVHLIHAELQDELRAGGFAVAPGSMGENLTTRGLDLLALPVGARLRVGAAAVVEITGLRNPCVQLDHFQDGLMSAVLGRAVDGSLIRRAGVMGVVVAGSDVRPGDVIDVELPDRPHQPLQPV